jgi:hypothetical protein
VQAPSPGDVRAALGPRDRTVSFQSRSVRLARSIVGAEAASSPRDTTVRGCLSGDSDPHAWDRDREEAPDLATIDPKHAEIVGRAAESRILAVITRSALRVSLVLPPPSRSPELVEVGARSDRIS